MFNLRSKFFKLKGDYFHGLDWQRSRRLLIITADKVVRGKALSGSASGGEMPLLVTGIGGGRQFLSKTLLCSFKCACFQTQKFFYERLIIREKKTGKRLAADIFIFK